MLELNLSEQTAVLRIHVEDPTYLPLPGHATPARDSMTPLVLIMGTLDFVSWMLAKQHSTLHFQRFGARRLPVNELLVRIEFQSSRCPP